MWWLLGLPGSPLDRQPGIKRKNRILTRFYKQSNIQNISVYYNNKYTHSSYTPLKKPIKLVIIEDVDKVGSVG